MGKKSGADEFAVPGPDVLRVSGRVDSDETATGPHVRLQTPLLHLVEYVASRREKDDHPVATEIRQRELLRVVGCVHGESVGRAQLAYCRNAVADGVVTKSRCLRKN